MSSAVFVDTSGIVALLWAKDAWHLEAVRTWKRLVQQRTRFVTTDLVIAESVALARARAGFALAVDIGDRLLAAPFETTWVDRELMRAAWKLYRKYADHYLSLCDCVSFALMEQKKIRHAFAYDDDFVRVGFLHVKNEP